MGRLQKERPPPISFGLISCTTAIGQCCLGRGKAGHRHAEGAAGNVIETHAFAEADAGWVAAVLAADSKLESGLRAAALFYRGPYQRTHAGSIQRNKWIFCEHPGFYIMRQE